MSACSSLSLRGDVLVVADPRDCAVAVNVRSPGRSEEHRRSRRPKNSQDVLFELNHLLTPNTCLHTQISHR